MPNVRLRHQDQDGRVSAVAQVKRSRSSNVPPNKQQRRRPLVTKSQSIAILLINLINLAALRHRYDIHRLLILEAYG